MLASCPPRKKLLCDEERLSVLIRAWQQAPPSLKDEWWEQFVNESADWLMAIIRSFKCDLTSLGCHEDVRAEILLHLHNRVLPAFRLGKGRLYSLVTVSVNNYILTLLEKAGRYTSRNIAIDFFGTDPEVFGRCHEPEVYSFAAEIRQRLEHFTARNGDSEFFLVKNILVYAHTQLGRGGPGQYLTAEEVARLSAKFANCRRSVPSNGRQKRSTNYGKSSLILHPLPFALLESG